jgi:sugar phosphate isomerase/epimerase
MCLTEGLEDLSGLVTVGFEAVQVAMPGVPPEGQEPDDPDPDALIAELRRNELDLAAIAVHAPLFGDSAAVHRGRVRMRQLIDYAARLRKAPTLNRRPLVNWHAAGYLHMLDAGVESLLSQLAASLAQVCTYARSKRVDISIEMTRMGLPDNVDKFLRLRARTKASNLYACVDAANFTPDRDPLEAAVRRLGKYVAYAHAKDVVFRPDGTVLEYPPAGRGMVDYDAFIAALRECTPCKYLLAEYMPDKRAVRSVVRFLKGKLAS